LLHSVEENQFLPWTWARITPSELRNINAWMAKALKVDDVEDQLLAAVLWIAMATGRSLARALTIKISHIPEDEWSVTQKCFRHSPAGEHGVGGADVGLDHWATPELPLPADVAEIFGARLVPIHLHHCRGDLFAPKLLLSRFRESTKLRLG
jgi:hypothetical protein